jgi:hypothetical protein
MTSCAVREMVRHKAKRVENRRIWLVWLRGEVSAEKIIFSRCEIKGNKLGEHYRSVNSEECEIIFI